jgi:U6 snRNA-associated Sm-like protein LSm2
MLFFQLFQQLVESKATVVVELKNDLQISGQLQSVDQYLNVKLIDVSIDNPEKYPHLVSLKNCFIRGSVVRYIHLKPTDVSIEKLEDSCRREAKNEKNARKEGKAN